MFSVTGRIGGVVYTAHVGDPAAPDHPGAVGVVTGSPVILALLTEATGRTHSATPTGPSAVLDPTDPESVLIALMDLTRVIKTVGDDVPAILTDDAPAGAVY